ncbi:MAG: DMT family transporter [Pseudomonadota bacterium]
MSSPRLAEAADGSARTAGILWMVAATALFVALDATAKLLTSYYPVGQVVWARFTFHFLFVLILLAPRGRAGLTSRRPGLQLLRAACMLGANLAFFLAIRTMPLVEASAIVFCGPLFVTALSVPLLGEQVGLRRWSAVCVGFAGAMIIIRPGPDIFQSVAVLPMLAALSFAFYQIFTRKLTGVDAPMTTLLYTAVVGAVLSSAYVPWIWVPPDVPGFILLLMTGLLGAAGQLALIEAVSRAPVSVVAPFNYLGLVWASLLGFLIFGDLPESWTLVGAAIIAASGLYILRREAARRLCTD